MTMSEMEPRTHVRTTRDAGADDWSAEALKSRQWGVQGVVIRSSNAHGLCYLVRHPDGTQGWYEAEELVRDDEEDDE
jgi:hypothetical protein